MIQDSQYYLYRKWTRLYNDADSDTRPSGEVTGNFKNLWDDNVKALMEHLVAAERPNTPLRWLQLHFFVPQNWQRSSTISNIFQALHVFADCWLLFWKDLISADLTGNRPAKLISHKFSRSAAVPELIRRRQHTHTHSLMSTYRNTARMPKTMIMTIHSSSDRRSPSETTRKPAQSACPNTEIRPPTCSRARPRECFPSVCVSKDKHVTSNHKMWISCYSPGEELLQPKCPVFPWLCFRGRAGLHLISVCLWQI